jgi:hypothetical protein
MNEWMNDGVIYIYIYNECRMTKSVVIV